MMRRRKIVRRAAAVLAACALALCLGGCGQGSGVGVKGSVADYTWEELSLISQEIAAAPDEAAAVSVAQSYHLTSADGTLDGTQAKDLVLADGTATQAVVVGFAQDVHPDGSPAGITFMLTDAVGPRPINNDAGFTELSDSTDMVTMGGWTACELRRWINGDFCDELPTDLRKSLVEVEKTSTAFPSSNALISDSDMLESASTTLTETTADLIWIPSVSEVTGVADDTYSAEVDMPGWRDVLRLEGAQYKLFADAGVHEEEPSALLARSTGAWWLRTLEDGFFYEVAKDGTVDRSECDTSPATPQGVVPFFCI